MNEVKPLPLQQSYHPSIMAEPASVASPLLALGILRRRKLSILFVGAILSCLSVLGVSLMKKSYVATASVLIQQQKSPVIELQTTGAMATDSVVVRTQADVLRSADLARSVIDDLKLTEAPEFGAPSRSAWALRLVDWLRVNDVSGVMNWLGLFDQPAPPTDYERQTQAVDKLIGMTSIVNDGKSYVIDIRVKVAATEAGSTAHAAALSAAIANAYADTYTRFTSSLKSNAVRQANRFFDARIAALQAKMQKAEHAVEAYRSEHNLTEDRAASSAGGPVTIAAQQMAQLNSALIAASADRTTKEASLEQIHLALSGRGDLQSVAEVVASPLIQRLREQQTEFGAKEAGLAMSRGSGSPDLIAVRGSQRGVEAQIALEASKIGNSLRGAANAARAREATLRVQLAALQAQVGAEGKTEIKLRELQNEADIARTIYSTYLKKSEETSEQLDMQEPDALVISRAGIPLAPAPPSSKQLAALGVVVSFCLAALGALIRERMRGGFRTTQEFEDRTGIETLGYVPKVGQTSLALRFRDPNSAFSEAILSVRSLLRLTQARGGPRVVMVTSALPKEGKTFFASALARNAALAGVRTLIIDCDLRRPTVANHISAGVSQIVGGVTIGRDNLSPLDVITLTSPAGSAADLFASTQMADLIMMVRERYQLIILDTPPVLAVSDARVLAPLADATLLVVCWQSTAQNLVTQAANALRNSGAHLAGAVITQVRLRELTRADGAHAYAQYYSKSLLGRV